MMSQPDMASYCQKKNIPIAQQSLLGVDLACTGRMARCGHRRHMLSSSPDQLDRP